MRLAHFAAVSAVATAFIVLLAGVASAGEAPPGFWTHPAIEDFGKIHPLPKAAYQPDPAQTHKIVFFMTAASKQPGEINPAIERVARAVNLYASAGVPLGHLKFVAIAAGAATAVALNDTQYHAAFGVANPNLPVIAALRKAGVEVLVCGQAWAEHQYQYDWVDPSVTVALSAVIVVATLQNQGYSLMPLL